MPGINLRNETKVGLLYALKAFTEQETGDMKLKVKRQSRDEREPERRPATVYLTHLTDMLSYEKKAPFIIHQAVTSLDELEDINKWTGQKIRRGLVSTGVIRSVFCIYNPDGQEGGLELLNLMEIMRVALLQFPTLDKKFELDQNEGINQMVYPETGERGAAPFYLGEMVTVWKLPPIRRLDAERVIHGLPAEDPGAARTDRLLP